MRTKCMLLPFAMCVCVCVCVCVSVCVCSFTFLYVFTNLFLYLCIYLERSYLFKVKNEDAGMSSVDTVFNRNDF